MFAIDQANSVVPPSIGTRFLRKETCPKLLKPLAEARVLLEVPINQFANSPVDDLCPIRTHRLAENVQIERHRFMDMKREFLRLARHRCGNGSRHIGGGLYWPGPGDERDHKRGFDANDREIDTIIDDVIARVKQAASNIDEPRLKALLNASRVDDLTEYGRPVHAEMEALLACARTGVSTQGGTLYTTTFPCHNCAKHIVGAGIARVVYVEPYPKSQALALHGDSLALDDPDAENRVRFVPFVGVAARRFFDLFSMRLGDGLEMQRKKGGQKVAWQRTAAKPRIRMSPYSYLERELIATNELVPAAEALQEAVQPETERGAEKESSGR